MKFCKIVSVVICVFVSSSVKAEFDILEHTSSSIMCDGTIEVLADGSAGPFEVRLFNSTGTLASTANDITDYVIFEGVCPGLYQVTAVNSQGCDHYIGMVEIEENCRHLMMGEEGLEANIIDFGEPTYGNCDGYVSFSLDWVNGTITQVNIYNSDRTLINGHSYVERSNIFENLCGRETYFIEVEVSDGCKLDVITFDLDEVCAATNINLAYIYNTEMSTDEDNGGEEDDPDGYIPVMDNCTGEIALEELPGYSYQWSVSQDDQQGAQAYNLCKGSYEVTITDQLNNCVDIRSYKVGFDDCETPRFDKWQIGPAGLSANGFLEFMIPYGISSQFHTARLLLNGVEIASQSLTAGETVRFENLGENTYKLKIFSNCGYNMRDVVIPCMLDLENEAVISQSPIGSASGCDNAMERLSVTLPNLNDANYRWEWSTGETTQFIDVSVFTEYILKIFRIGTNCYDEFNFYPTNIYGIDLEASFGECPLLSNGSAIISINNAELSSNASFLLNGELYDANYILGDNLINIDNLSTGVYEFTYLYNGCSTSISFTIGISDRFEAEYVGIAPLTDDNSINGSILDRTNWGCYYQYKCDGIVYLENVPRERVSVDLSSGGNNCKVNLECGTRVVGTHKFPKKGVSVYEYINVIEAAKQVYVDDFRFPPAFFQDLINRANENEGCCRLTYCTANFRITKRACRIFGTGPVLPPAVVDDGCIKISCEDALTPRIRICPERDYPPHILNKDVDILSSFQDLSGANCQRIYRFNVSQMYYWLPQWDIELGEDFFQSELRAEINRIFSLGDESGCSFISFCYPSFGILYTESPRVACGTLIGKNKFVTDEFDFACDNFVPAGYTANEAVRYRCAKAIPCIDESELKCYSSSLSTIYKDSNLAPTLNANGFNDTGNNKESGSVSNSKSRLADEVHKKSEILNESFTVSPNPFNSIININLSRRPREGEGIRIFDLLGRKLVDDQKLNTVSTNITIDKFSALGEGVYVVQWYNTFGVVSTKRIVKIY